MTDRHVLKEYDKAKLTYLNMDMMLSKLQLLSLSDYLSPEDRKTVRTFIKDLMEMMDTVQKKKGCLRIEIESKLDERPEVRE